MQVARKCALVLGGAGNLGRQVVKVLQQNHRVVSLDLHENAQADTNITIADFLGKGQTITEKLDAKSYAQFSLYCQARLKDFSPTLDSVICVSGGFVMGKLKEADVLQKYEDMESKNILPALLAAHLAAKFLSPEGFLLLTSASKVLKEPCENFVAYALSKCAVHSLALNLINNIELPDTATVVTILPTKFPITSETIDSEQNRVDMPKADFKKWQKAEQIAGLVKTWADGFNRPKSGALALLKTKEGSTVYDYL